MKMSVSALMDGELEHHEVEATLRALRSNAELRGQWRDGQLIGAALRDEQGLDLDVVAQVMSAIDLEPTVLAPAPRRNMEWQRPALALAASAAGVAVVAWLALVPAKEPVVPAGLAAQPAPVVARSQSTPRLQEYLVAHQAYAPSGAMVGGARNIRTVAASGQSR